LLVGAGTVRHSTLSELCEPLRASPEADAEVVLVLRADAWAVDAPEPEDPQPARTSAPAAVMSVPETIAVALSD
jgi:hypothetical protein